MTMKRWLRLINLAREHDPEVYAWVLKVEADRQGGKRLECAIGITPAELEEERNLALCRATELLAGSLSTWKKAEILEAAIREAKQLSPELLEDEVGHELSLAMACGDVPGSVRQLYRILTRSGGGVSRSCSSNCNQ